MVNGKKESLHTEGGVSNWFESKENGRPINGATRKSIANFRI